MRHLVRESAIFIRLGSLVVLLCAAPASAAAEVQVPIVPVSCVRVDGRVNPCVPASDVSCAAVDSAVGPTCVADSVRAPAPPVAPVAPVGTVTDLQDWQVAYFRRGGAALVVAAFDVSRNKLFWQFLAGWGTVPLGGPQPAPWSVGLFAPSAVTAEDSGRAPAATTVEGPPRAKWIAAIDASWDSLALGLDLVAPADPAAPIPIVRSGATGRVRVTAQPPAQPSQRVQLSDILLYEPDERQAPRMLEGATGAMARALGTTTLGGRQRIGMYWETYGLEDGDATAIELTALPVADPAGGVDARTPVGLGWEIVAPGGVSAGMPHGFVLDLRALKPGRYDLTVTVSVPGQESVSVTRRIRVEIDSGW